MNKIIRVALEAKFPGIDYDAMLEVLNATPNVVIAMETLLGCYETPEIPMTSTHVKSNQVCTFISFSKYTEKVEYSYDSIQGKSLYFESKEDADACVSYDETKGRDYYARGNWNVERNFRVPYIAKSTCDLRTWLGK